MESELDTLVEAVLASSKYRHVSPSLVREIGARELAIRPNKKAAIKATKNVLHQAGGAFQDASINYNRARETLEAALQKDDRTTTDSEFANACRAIMAAHTSTRERLSILDDFYRETLTNVPPPQTVLDVACGLNPLARPWMPFPASTQYIASDIYADQVAFLNDYIALSDYAGYAEVRDVHDPPPQAADLALVLKTLPCLEAIDKGAPDRLLDALNAPYLLVSFPAQSWGTTQGHGNPLRDAIPCAAGCAGLVGRAV
ncbi:MAG: 16S rRNA methyltransferase [Chloroflexota bacterium]